MWNQPATARQIAALKANGNFDGKFYSKGRAGEAIGESVRAAGAMPGPAGSTQRRPSSMVGTNELAGLAELVAQMRPVLGDAEPAGEQVVLGEVVERERLDARRARTPVGDPGGVLSIEFLARLEARHLDGYRAHHTYGSAKGLRDETTAWNDLKLDVAKQISEAMAVLLAVLRDAPRDAVPAPQEAARALLAQAVDPDLEESHLWTYLSQHTYGSGDGLRGEVRDWLDNRISIASTNAHGLIELARLRAESGPEAETSIRAASAPALAAPESLPAAGQTATAPTAGADKARPARARRRGPVSTGTVTSINASGAHVRLGQGARGWLHISKLRILNGGARVEDVSEHLRIGQEVHVRAIGTNERGQTLLELVAQESGGASQAVSEPSVHGQPVDQPVGECSRRGFFWRRTPRG